MSFLYPLGLLGLIGIPVLIIIYIIKSKYTEQTIASTYLWTLSERFLKRKSPVSKLAGIISLILQLLAITLISLAIAHPIITIPGSANEYCFILDSSGSMQTESGRSTRFELAKEEIDGIIAASIDGSTYTLICVGDSTSVIYERLEDKEQARMLLDEQECAYCTADFTKALGLAQGYFNENPALLTYLATDTEYEGADNIELISVADKSINYALSDVDSTHIGGQLTLTGNIASYGESTDLTIELFIDGAESPVAAEKVSLEKDSPAPFSISAKVGAYESVRVAIKEEDSLPLDNQFIIFNVKSESSYKTLIVSERPFFIESMLGGLISADIDVITPDKYSQDQIKGYGLYVFDSVEFGDKTELPKDGTVWLLNVSGSVEGSGFSVQGEVTLEGSDTLSLTASSSSTAKALTSGLIGNDIHITRYIKCGFYRNFTTVYSYKGNPAVFVGTNANGNREAVFAFDIHDSNLPLLYDFSVLMTNLVKYSFPDMVESTAFECGTSADINVITNCQSIRVESPNGSVSYLDTDRASDSILLTEVGVYDVVMTLEGSAREFSIFSAMAKSESAPSVAEERIGLQGEPSSEGRDGKFDPLILMIVLLAIIVSADWMVYCYEKYQLR